MIDPFQQRLDTYFAAIAAGNGEQATQIEQELRDPEQFTDHTAQEREVVILLFGGMAKAGASFRRRTSPEDLAADKQHWESRNPLSAQPLDD